MLAMWTNQTNIPFLVLFVCSLGFDSLDGWEGSACGRHIVWCDKRAARNHAFCNCSLDSSELPMRLSSSIEL